MLKNLKIIPLLAIIGMLLAACTAGQTPTPQAVDEGTLFVAPFWQTCEGAAPMLCMQVKETEAADWQLFYENIEGFDYDPGYQYELVVRTEEVANPPADASSLRWILVEQVSKTPIEIPQIAMEGTLWYLQSISGTPLVAETEITLDFFAAQEVGGDAGCNRYNTTYQLQGIAFEVGEIITTEIACEAAILEQETRYLQILRDSQFLQLQEDQLLLITPQRQYLEFMR